MKTAGGGHASRRSVTGPSFTSSTAMSAPKRPVATVAPSSVRASPNAATSGSAAPAGVGVEGELAHDQRGAARLGERPIHRALVVAEDPQVPHLLGEPAG